MSSTLLVTGRADYDFVIIDIIYNEIYTAECFK